MGKLHDGGGVYKTPEVLQKSKNYSLMRCRSMAFRLRTVSIRFCAMGITVAFGMTVLIEHFGLFITMLLTAEVGGEGDREGGEGGELFHRGQETPTGAWSRWACKWEWMLLKVDTLKIL